MVGKDQSTEKSLSKGFGKALLPQQWAVAVLWIGGLMKSLALGGGEGGDYVSMVLISVLGA